MSLPSFKKIWFIGEFCLSLLLLGCFLWFSNANVALPSFFYYFYFFNALYVGYILIALTVRQIVKIKSLRRQHAPKLPFITLLAIGVGFGLWWYQLTWRGDGLQLSEFLAQPAFVIINVLLFNIVAGLFAHLSFQSIYYVLRRRDPRLRWYNVVYPLCTLNYLIGYYPPLFTIGSITQSDLYAVTTALPYWVYPIYLIGEVY